MMMTLQEVREGREGDKEPQERVGRPNNNKDKVGAVKMRVMCASRMRLLVGWGLVLLLLLLLMAPNGEETPRVLAIEKR